MSFFTDIRDDVDKGRKGGFQGISLDLLPRLDEYLTGIQAGRIDLIGADSGTGKTSFSDYVYLINPINSIANGLTDFDYQVDYYSLEISKKRKLTKLAALYMYMEFGIIIDYKKLLSFGKKENRLDDYLYQSFLKTEGFMELLQDHVRIHERRANPTKIAIGTSKYRKSIGKIKYGSVENPDKKLLDKNPFANDPIRKYEYEEVHVPNNDKLIHMVVVDHIGKLQREHEESVKKSKGMNRLLDVKSNLDRHSSYCVEHRNFYGTSYVNINQFNRGLADVTRQRFTELRPGREDFKDTGNTFEDSDLVMALFDPEVYNIKKYLGFDIAKLLGRGRFLFILKYRDGDGNVDMGLRFIGECGHFCELPIPTKDDDPILYRKIMNLDNKLIVE